MNVVVIGETCVDKFIYGESPRLCPEAPVSIFVPKISNWNEGMSGNVIKNVEALEPTARLYHLFQRRPITKTRFVDYKSNHMFLRVDEGEPIDEELKLLPEDEEAIKNADIVIVSDYNKGFLTNELLIKIGKLSKLSILDSKRILNNETIHPFTFVKLNKSEALQNPYLNHNGLIITLGEEGASHKGKIIKQVNPRQTIDVSGAGDTFTTAFILNYYKTKEIYCAIEYANKIAGEVVTQRGVVTPKFRG